jgi:hypothetical protein
LILDPRQTHAGTGGTERMKKCLMYINLEKGKMVSRRGAETQRGKENEEKAYFIFLTTKRRRTRRKIKKEGKKRKKCLPAN